MAEDLASWDAAGPLDDGVARYVPHRNGMLWLQQLAHVDGQGAHAIAQVQADGMFVRAGRLPVWTAIEYMAQTVAAWAGNRCLGQGEAAKIGYLLGTRRFEVFRQHFLVGEQLHIHVQREFESDEGLGMFACTVVVDGQLAARAHLSVFQPRQAAPRPDGLHAE